MDPLTPISKILESLQSEQKAILLRAPSLNSEGLDHDLYLPKEALKETTLYLEENSFTSLPSKTGTSKFVRFFKDDWEILDLEYSAEYLFENFKVSSHQNKLQKELISNSKTARFIRYVILQKKTPHAQKFIREEFENLEYSLHESNLLPKDFFKKSFTNKEELIGFMNRDFLTMLKYIGFLKTLFWYKQKITSYTNRNKYYKKRIAIIGPDGSGKTTVIKNLKKIIPHAQTIYMGDKGFILQPLYNFLSGRHILFSSFSYFLFFFENLNRYIKSCLMNFKGGIIFFDRYPGFNNHLKENNLKTKLSNTLYAIFPNPSIFVFIYATTEQILERKPELSELELSSFQKNIKNKLKRKNSVTIENDQIEKTMNELLSVILITPFS